RDLARTIKTLVPNYMPMGSAGMAEMGAMEMPMPDNTLPMMTGFGQFGPMEMGGMFSVVKVRDAIAGHDYADPGPYRHPDGTVAYEFAGDAGPAPRRSGNAPAEKTSIRTPAAEFRVVKPGARGAQKSSH